VEVAGARTSWHDDQALYLGIKAGRNGVNHANLDLGSFIFEALGERWIIDVVCTLGAASPLHLVLTGFRPLDAFACLWRQAPAYLPS